MFNGHSSWAEERVVSSTSPFVRDHLSTESLSGSCLLGHAAFRNYGSSWLLSFPPSFSHVYKSHHSFPFQLGQLQHNRRGYSLESLESTSNSTTNLWVHKLQRNYGKWNTTLFILDLGKHSNFDRSLRGDEHIRNSEFSTIRLVDEDNQEIAWEISKISVNLII